MPNGLCPALLAISSHLLACQIKDGVENPERLRQHQMGDPGPARDELLGSAYLIGIVAHDQPDQDIGINPARGAGTCNPDLRGKDTGQIDVDP